MKIMIKKILFYTMSLVVLTYGSHNDEVGFNVSTTSIINEDHSKFSNYGFGGSFQMSRYVVSPRFDLDYVGVSDYKGVNSLFKASVNGVYEFENSTRVLPYGLMGLGYERVTPEVKNNFESHLFVQLGLGLAYTLSNEYKMRFETKRLQILSGNKEENEMILSLGMSFPLGYKEKVKVKKVPRSRPIIPVFINIPPSNIPPFNIPTNTPTFTPPSNRCPKKINAPDKDRDGVEDRIDQCPNTPCAFVVDSYGCPVKLTLRINFAIGSARIKEDSMHKIANFATFLIRNRGSMVKIIGHTDSVGTDLDNLALSIKRAHAVVNKLLEMGVSPSRITAEGRGEREPLVSNYTNEGKRQNRRIEIILSYPNIERRRK
jgi:OOP family OmpA-OmpF porin